ncbi:MAG: ABC transporter permease subunit [Clostridia bacterium]|nr:ABC transporter permease subunit [Clostridia bacterium]
MTASITARNNKDIIKKASFAIIAVIFWIGLWWVASILIGEDLRLFLPSPFAVAKTLVSLVATKDFWTATLLTILRIFAGFILGAMAGIVSGMLTSHIKIADAILSPALKIIRAVPVVSFIILAFLFMSIDALPIFISFLMVTPLVWQSTHDALQNSCKELEEMGRVFKMGALAILFKIKLPSITGEIITALVTGLGFAWKSGVAAEVLYSPNISIGKNIYIAKANLDFSGVYAYTLTVVALSLVIEILLKRLCGRYLLNAERGKANA